MNGEVKSRPFTSLEEIIYSHAVGIDSDNSALWQWSGLQDHRKRLAELRAALRQEVAREIRIILRREKRRELTAKLRMVTGEQLNRLLAGYFERGKQTLAMQLQSTSLEMLLRSLAIMVDAGSGGGGGR